MIEQKCLFGQEFKTQLETNQYSFTTKQDAIDYYFNYYKQNGYPNYNINDYNSYQELQTLKEFNTDKIFDGKNIQQTMHSCGFLWCFFPDWINTRTFDNESLYECFNDDKKLYDLIRKVVEWNFKHSYGIWSTNRIRQCAKVYCAKQTVSNFRPTAAKFIYDKFGNDGKVLDPCCGWGGRLFGFLSSKCKEYVGCDPNTKTYNGLNEIKELYTHENKSVSITNCGFEDLEVKENYFDLVFTSPPYFNTEKYSDEETQSYKKFPQYEDWKNNFLKVLITKSYKALKDDGTFVFNIANVKTAPTLQEDTIQIANDCGFILIDTLNLILSSIAGNGIKTEPVFVFKKD